MRSTLPLTLALTAVTLAAPLTADDGPDPQSLDGDPSSGVIVESIADDAIRLMDETLFVDEPGDGRVWAVGRTWKASFGPDGFVYVPFFGSEAPRSFPVRFELESARVGATELEVAPSPSPVHEDHVVQLNRGGVVETYHLDLEGVEQTFVFDRLPQSAGDVVLRMKVETDLLARPDGAGFVFEGELGEVRYGAATALDAAGRTLALEQTLVPGGIEIVVPDSFVRSASWPLVVDPVVSTFTVTDSSRNYVGVDCAYHEPTQLYMIAYERVESAGDHDMFAAYYNVGLGGFLTPSVVIDSSLDDWRAPSVGACYQDQVFLCVAQEGSIGFRSIVARTRDAVSGVRGPQFTISPPGNDHFAPDVGGYGDDITTAFDFAVVWQRNIALGVPDIDVLAQAVNSDGSLSGSRVEISGGPEFDLQPRISKSSGPVDFDTPEHEYMIVWEREVSGGQHRVFARTVDRFFNLGGRPLFRAYDVSADARNPDVSSQVRQSQISLEPYYVITFERLKGGDYEIYTVVAENGSNFNGDDIALQQDLGQTTEQRNPRIGFDGQDFLILYQSEDGMGGWDAYLTAVNVVIDANDEIRCAVAERRTELRVPDGSVDQLTIATQYDGGRDPFGGGPENAGLALWTAEGSTGSDLDVAGAVVAENSLTVSGRPYCDANPNASGTSAWMRVAFDQRPGTTKILSCQDLPPNSFGHFIVGTGNAVTPNPGGSEGDLCISGSLGRYSNFVANSGPSGYLELLIDPTSIPQPMGTAAAMPGETWYFQCWTRDSVNGMATSNFSNAVALVFR